MIFNDILRGACSRPQVGQVTVRSIPLPRAISQTEFRLMPHFPDLPAVSVAMVSTTPLSTAVIIATKRNTMLPVPQNVASRRSRTYFNSGITAAGGRRGAINALQCLSCWQTPFS